MDLPETFIDIKGMPPDMLPLAIQRNPFGTAISSQHKTHKEASMRLRVWHHNGLFIWHWKCFFTHDTTLVFEHPVTLAGIVASIENTFVYSLNNRRYGKLKEGQYNMLFNTQLSYQVRFAGNHPYDAFGIHFPINYLRGWKGEFDWLKGFIHKTSFQKAAWLRRKPFAISARMESAIQDLQYCPYDGLILTMYRKTKSQELILLAFNGVMEEIIASKTNLSAADYQRIGEAIDYLRCRPELKVRPATLAKAVGVNEAKLKAGFQRLYFTSPHAFHLDDKMQKACDLLLETNLPIGEIGERMGFKSLSNFTATFKRITGIAPRKMRERY